MREKHFAAAMEAKSAENLKKFLPLADQALGQLVQQGDMKAITFVNQLTGRFDANSRQGVDVPALLLQVQDIVLRHVRDPITKRNIGRELVALASGAGPLSVIAEPQPDDILVSETVFDVTPVLKED
jgi:glutaredoxin-related protein